MFCWHPKDAMKKLILIVQGLSLAMLCSCGGGGGSGGSGSSTGPTNGAPVPDTVSGTVFFNNAPLAGATVTAYSNNTNPSKIFAVVTTDGNGQYSIADFPTGCYCISNFSLVASKTGYGFNPFMAGNPTGDRSSYVWNPAPHNWQTPTGANVTRADFTGMFANVNASGMIYNTIDFNAVTNNNVTGANFNAYNGSNPLVSLSATGQKVSYVTGDDADEHKGVAWPAGRFADNLNGSVTDHLTGLVWMKDAGCLTPALWGASLAEVAALASGSCGLSDGSVAGQWRLPNIIELESLVDVSASNPALPSGHPFVNVSNGIYWSSTPYYGGIAGSSNAWTIRMGDARYINDSASNVMSTSVNGVWAVRGAGAGTVQLQATGAYVQSAKGDDGSIEAGTALPAPRMQDNGNGTVTDTLTGLIWLKQGDCISQSWSGAVAAVKALASGQCGLSDGSSAGSWRMPNRNEMQSLADRSQNNLADWLDQNFTSLLPGVMTRAPVFANFVQFQYYWTSSTDAANTSDAWTVFSCDYGVYEIPKTSVGYTLAVR